MASALSTAKTSLFCHRFALTSLPHSGARDGRKAVQFGKDDVRALCAVLGADGHSYSQDGGTGVDGNSQWHVWKQCRATLRWTLPGW